MSEPVARARFLRRIAARQGPPDGAGPHPPPPEPTVVPEVRVRAVDGIDPGDREALLDVFVAAAESVDTVVHRSDPGAAVAAIVERHGAERAVLSPEPAAQALAEPLQACGVSIRPLDRGEAEAADLGVTGCVAAIAGTGSLVIDADRAGGRITSLLPRVHVCVLDRAELVAGTADVLRRPDRALPSHRVLVTGPSRTGDVEHILTVGAHGPVAVHVLVV